MYKVRTNFVYTYFTTSNLFATTIVNNNQDDYLGALTEIVQ